MAYAAQADLVPGRLALKNAISLTSDANPLPAQPDATVIAAKLGEASGQIEMYCRERYKVPLQPTAELVGLACTIAVYLLYARKPGPVPEQVTTTYQDAMRFLRDIAAGKASLDQPIGSVDQAPSGGVVRSGRRQRFSNSNLRGFD